MMYHGSGDAPPFQTGAELRESAAPLPGSLRLVVEAQGVTGNENVLKCTRPAGRTIYWVRRTFPTATGATIWVIRPQGGTGAKVNPSNGGLTGTTKEVEWLQIPSFIVVGALRYQVLQTLDDAGQIGWDYVRLHMNVTQPPVPP